MNFPLHGLANKGRPILSVLQHRRNAVERALGEPSLHVLRPLLPAPHAGRRSGNAEPCQNALLISYEILNIPHMRYSFNLI